MGVRWRTLALPPPPPPPCKGEGANSQAPDRSPVEQLPLPALPQRGAGLELAPGEPEGFVAGQLGLAGKGAQAARVAPYFDTRQTHRLTRAERDLRRGARECQRLAVGRSDAQHHLVHRQARIDIADRKDRPAVVTAAERIERVAAADAAVARQDGGARIALRQAPQVEVITVACASVTPAFCSGPEMARPVKVSKADQVLRSYMNLFERESSPDVRNIGSKPLTRSVKYACAARHSVQYGIAMRRPPSVSLTISCTSIMFFG